MGLYSDNDKLSHLLFDRMYLDSHQIQIDFNQNKQIKVSTQSDEEFDNLICDGQRFEYAESESLMFDHKQYYHSKLIPFLMNKQKNEIKILIKHEEDCMDFVCSSKLDYGYIDTAQNISSYFL